jgi:hypothetical protein
MAFLWTKAADKWATHPLDGTQSLLENPAGHSIPPIQLHFSEETGNSWYLLASSNAAVSINTVVVRNGIRVLHDKDLIRWGDQQFYFTTDGPLLPAPFPGSGAPCLCPRCKTEILPGRLAIHCHCGIWVHEDASIAKPCFSYGETCPVCSQRTDQAAAFSFNPQEL